MGVELKHTTPQSEASAHTDTPQLYSRRLGANASSALSLDMNKISQDKPQHHGHPHGGPHSSTSDTLGSPFSTPTAVLEFSDDYLNHGVTEDMLKGASPRRAAARDISGLCELALSKRTLLACRREFTRFRNA
eukprot:scaffold1582_cov363-Prasinococcus_capsulatus_cf.AAC.2